MKKIDIEIDTSVLRYLIFCEIKQNNWYIDISGIFYKKMVFKVIRMKIEFKKGDIVKLNKIVSYVQLFEKKVVEYIPDSIFRLGESEVKFTEDATINITI